jgi:hypothetical protein
MTPITLIIIAGIGLVIVRQFQARELRTGPLLAIPIVLIALGLQTFSAGPPTTAAGIAVFAVSVLVSIGVGVLRGRSERIWHTANGAPWRQATSRTALLWAASIAARVVALLIARAAGDHSPATAQVELLLGLSFAAQHAVLARRAGLPHRPLAPATSTN